MHIGPGRLHPTIGAHELPQGCNHEPQTAVQELQLTVHTPQVLQEPSELHQTQPLSSAEVQFVHRSDKQILASRIPFFIFNSSKYQVELTGSTLDSLFL